MTDPSLRDLEVTHFVYILSAEPVHTDSTRSSLKPKKNTCFFVRHLNFRDVYSLKKKKTTPHVSARAPHVRLCGEFTAQPHVRCGILGLVFSISTSVVLSETVPSSAGRFVDASAAHQSSKFT
jgi:hypothetical protein